VTAQDATVDELLTGRQNLIMICLLYTSTSGAISEASSFGDVLHSLLGYADQPTELQACVWLVYLVLSTILFIRVGKSSGRRGRTSDSSHLVNDQSVGRETSTLNGET